MIGNSVSWALYFMWYATNHSFSSRFDLYNLSHTDLQV